MNYNLSRKNEAGKYWTYGRIKKNQWGNSQASFKVSDLKELIRLAEKEGKEWVNLSLFENKGVGEAEMQRRAEERVAPTDVASADMDSLNDEVPF